MDAKVETKPNLQDLRTHLENLQKHDKLTRITVPINKDTELMPLVRWQFRGLQQDQRKGFLFENVTNARGEKLKRQRGGQHLCRLAGNLRHRHGLRGQGHPQALAGRAGGAAEAGGRRLRHRAGRSPHGRQPAGARRAGGIPDPEFDARLRRRPLHHRVQLGHQGSGDRLDERRQLSRPGERPDQDGQSSSARANTPGSIGT